MIFHRGLIDLSSLRLFYCTVLVVKVLRSPPAVAKKSLSTTQYTASVLLLSTRPTPRKRPRKSPGENKSEVRLTRAHAQNTIFQSPSGKIGVETPDKMYQL